MAGARQDPEWYGNWRHEAVHQLQDKNARLDSEYRIGSWERYDYDVDAGTLVFSQRGVAKVIAEIQVVGTTSVRSDNWLWAWGNDHWPVERTRDSQSVRAFGEQHGILELMSDYVREDDLNALGWALTAVMARITDAVGGYRPPSETGALFLTYKSVAWVG